MATLGGLYTGPLTLGGRTNYAKAFPRPRFVPTGSLQAPPSTIGGSIEGGIAKALGKVTNEKRAAQYAQKIMAPLNDVTPVGNVLGAEEGVNQFLGGLSRGDLAAMGLGAGVFGLSVLPAPGAIKRAGKGMFGRMLKDESGAIRAWHGSPHDFDRFDMSKIGTGEGAQAYGHGLYFAENPEVAREYQRQLASDGFLMHGGRVFDPASELQHLNVRATLTKTGGDLQAAIDRAKGLLDTAPPTTLPLAQSDLALLEHIKAQGGLSKNAGKLYEVNINAEPEDFLDWDAPLLEHGETMQQAFAPAFPGGRPPYSKLMGAQAYRALLENRITSGQALPAAIKEQQMVADLRKSGIPGIRYLDQGSRNNYGLGGTRNYVVFDDSLVDILNKF